MLDMNDENDMVIPAERDLTGTVFSNPAFFRGSPHLTADNVMRYFCDSPFFDRSNNINLQIEMQQINDPQGRSDFRQRSSGYYYEVVGVPQQDPQNPQQPIWLISKKYSLGREGNGEMKDIALYYIVGQLIFQAPLWKEFASSKLWQASSSVHQALSEYWEQNAEAKDFDREIALADRPEDALLRSAYATLVKQFPDFAPPQNR